MRLVCSFVTSCNISSCRHGHGICSDRRTREGDRLFCNNERRLSLLGFSRRNHTERGAVLVDRYTARIHLAAKNARDIQHVLFALEKRDRIVLLEPERNGQWRPTPPIPYVQAASVIDEYAHHPFVTTATGPMQRR